MPYLTIGLYRGLWFRPALTYRAMVAPGHVLAGLVGNAHTLGTALADARDELVLPWCGKAEAVNVRLNH